MSILKRFVQHLSFVRWFFRVRVLGRLEPLQSVIFITNRCNLRCKHCNVVEERDCTTKSWAQIEEELKKCRAMGSRFVDFEGGEPFIWRDGDKTIDDLCVLAKKLGFFSTTITTNAQIPFDAPNADLIWVSLDGVGAYHDAVRGPGAFERLERNVAASTHPFLNANMAINRLNYESVEEVVRYVTESPRFKYLSVNFHTPYPGTEDLALDWETRCAVIDKLLELRKKGAPLMNSARGIRKLKDMNFTKRCWISNFVSVDGVFHKACLGEELGLCDRCGFGMATEMTGVYSLHPETVMAGLRARM